MIRDPAAPPRFLTRLLGRLLPETERDALLGDLEEEYRTRVLPERGRRAARRWYRGQVIKALRMTLSPTSAHEPPPSRLFAMGDLLHEIRFAVRQLRRRPLYAAVMMLTLGLGIGATSAVLSVANPILIRPLPYPDPDRIVLLNEVDLSGGLSRTGYATFLDVQSDVPALEHAAVFGSWLPVLTGSGEAEQLSGQRVSAEFFRVLGVAPALGRDFTAEEDAPGQTRVVVLSWGLWDRRFGRDPSVVGGTVTLGGTPHTVVGVMPRSFESLLSPSVEIWRPLGYDVSQSWACRTCRHLQAVARVRPGAPDGRLEAELGTLATQLLTDHPTQYAITGLRAEPLHGRLIEDVRPAVLLMLGAGVFVLLIACANAGNLVLARTAEREGELTLRAALGAGHRRLMQQLFVESAVLAAVGAGLGLLLARGGVAALVGLAPATLPRLDAIALDWRVVLITLAATLGTALVLGTVPAWLALRGRDASTSAPGTRAVTPGRAHRRLARALVVAEVALAFVLLAGAALLTRSLDRLLAVDPGFDVTNLLTMQVVASGPRYVEDEPLWQMQAQVLASVRNQPGVEHAALASQIPLGGNFDNFGVRIEDQPLANPAEAPGAMRYAVSDGYIETMGIAVTRGRGLTPADREGSQPVVLINEAFAELSWAGQDPIGKRVQMGAPDAPWRTIVGVTRTVRHTGLDEEQRPQFYVPTRQWTWAENITVLVVRTRGRPASVVPAVRQAVHAVDPELAISDVATAEDRIAVNTADRRLVLRLFEVFALVALVLAAAGIYGLLARGVTERRREIGIRAALGSTGIGIISLIVRDGLRLAAFGLLLGGTGAVAVSGLLGSLLFGVEPGDPGTLGVVALGLAAVAIIASVVPAWRAVRLDPVEVLRSE